MGRRFLLPATIVALGLAPAALYAAAGEAVPERRAALVERDTVPAERAAGERETVRGSGTSPAVYHLEQGSVLFDSTIADELANGRQLVDIEALTTSGPVTLFSGVFYPVTGTVHTLIHRDRGEWDDFLEMVEPLQGRWLDVEVGFHLGTERRYSALFLEDGDDYGYLVDTDMTDDALQTALQSGNPVFGHMEQELRGGRSMIDFEAYLTPGGETRFGAIWVEDPNQPMTHLYYDLTYDDMDALWNPLAGRIIDFERYHSSFYGEERFAMVVANVPGGDWHIDTQMTTSELETRNDNESDGNTHLIDLHVFDVGDLVPRFSGVWGPDYKSLNEVGGMPSDDEEDLTPDLLGLINNFENVSPNNEGIVGFYAKNLRTGQAVGYRENERFYLASTTKTAAHIRLWQLLEAGHFAPGNELGTMIRYTESSESGAPWYMDERSNPGFASGAPGFENNLGDEFSLDRFDRAMMTRSDNAATSALIADPDVGLAHDAVNLNEWVAGIDGVGQGWGLITTIQDVDRHVLTQGQHTDADKDEDSYFLAPGHTLRPRLFEVYEACSTTGPPATCVPASSCQRCNVDADCPGATNLCEKVDDPWGDLRSFFGLSSSESLPDYDVTTGRWRYYAMGLNSATPRAFSNLLEKFWKSELTTEATRDAALANMLTDNEMDDGVCRADVNGDGTCAGGEGIAMSAVKGGSRGNDTDGTAACIETGILRLGSEAITLALMTRENGIDCSNNGPNNDVPDIWSPQFGRRVLEALSVDLAPGTGQFGPSQVAEAGQIELVVEVDNVGGGDWPGPIEVEVWASLDGDIDFGSDVKLVELTLGGADGYSSVNSGIVAVALPSAAELPAGSYNLLVDVDGSMFGQVPELYESPASNEGPLAPGLLQVMPACPDDDGDGYADCDAGCLSNGPPCGDCDDDEATVYPGAPEQCNGVDDDCDTLVDNDISTPTYAQRVEDDDPVANDEFGTALANLGDVDGDGLDDLAVGMPGEDLDGTINVGIVRVISGADLSTICEAALPGAVFSDTLGWSTASAGGDLNGNGTADLLAGVPGWDGTSSLIGAVAAFNLPDCAFIRLMTDPALDGSDRLGRSVTSIGDVDGDGVPDVASGAPFANLAPGGQGAVSVFSGADGSVLFTLSDPAGDADPLGHVVVGPGDLTGDGVPDIVAGAHEADTAAGSARGAVYVFSGADGSLHDVWTETSPDFGGDVGISLAVLGDLTGDGTPEIAAGAPGDVVGGVRIGSVSIFDGSSGFLIRRLFDPDASSNTGFGAAVGAVEDLTGDGLPDVIVGATLNDELAGDAGTVYLFDSDNGAILRRLDNPAPWDDDGLGQQVVSLGDLSGDGVPEIAAAAPAADNIEAAQAGFVLVFSFEEDCDADGYSPYAGDCDDGETAISPDAVETCDTVDNDCDGAIDEDSDGDGFDVCADCDDLDARIRPGAIETCNGRDDDCNGQIDDGPDADGDLVQAPCDCDDDDPQVYPGQAELCDHVDADCDGLPDNGATTLRTARVSVLPDGMTTEGLGTAVAAVGDVDGDGIAEYVAGAPRNVTGGSGEGAAVLFDGATGAVRCIAAPLELAGRSELGTTVAGVGDVDGDSIPDFAAGAPEFDGDFNSVGAIYVFSGDDCATIRRLDDPAPENGDLLGLALAGIGDLDGDGVGEIAAGAPLWDAPNGSNSGFVRVWNGATGAAMLRLQDDRAGGGEVGRSVAGIGDVNADGIPDIVVGAPEEDGLLGGAVGVALVFSGADGSLLHKLFDPEGSGNDNLGTAVAGIDDLTGDAVPDILAGARREDSGGANNGAILVFSGADGTLARRVPLNDAATNLSFGATIAVLDDLDGDGIPEYAGGAPDDDTGGTNTGRVLILSGADDAVLHDIVLPDSAETSGLGRAIAGIADLSGDGFPELLLGEPGHDSLEDEDVGRVVVLAFESDCDDDGSGPFAGDCDDQSAFRTPGAAEICDGVDNDCDLAIDEDEDGDGADVCSDCETQVPTIYPGAAEVCNALDDNCNMQVDEGVDLDGDTFTVPCDCDDSDAGINASATEVCNAIDDNCDGRVDEGFGSPLDRTRIEDTQANQTDEMGTSLAAIGDVDGDGVPDLAIGIPGDDVAAASAGSVLLVSGASRAAICRLTHPDAASNDALGSSLAALGDVTGDGVPDVAAGAPRDDGAQGDTGAVHVFSGTSCGWVRTLTDPGGAVSAQLGTSVAAIGDVTGDGVPDIAAGAPRDDSDVPGEPAFTGSVVVFDGATGALLYKATDFHARSNDQLGISVSALGDVNFDNVPDFAAGAILDDVGSAGDAGAVSVFSGADGSWIRSLVDPERKGGYNLGRSIAPAGDVNGDGVPDLFAGCENDDTAGTNAGSVLAFSGADGSVIRRYTDSAPLAQADLGYAVAAGPDLNGDLVAELLAGAPGSTRSGVSAGEIVLFDGATGAVLDRFVDPAPEAPDDLGTAVAFAGDLTGGGGLELLAGAPMADPGGIDRAGYVALFSREPDCDGDGLSPLFDCDDADGDSQGEPGPVLTLVFDSETAMSWSPPADPGANPAALSYDVVRSTDVQDFATAPTCVETGDGTDTTAVASGTPGPDELEAYLVRVRNPCGQRVAPDADGQPRDVAECP